MADLLSDESIIHGQDIHSTRSAESSFKVCDSKLNLTLDLSEHSTDQDGRASISSFFNSNRRCHYCPFKLWAFRASISF